MHLQKSVKQSVALPAFLAAGKSRRFVVHESTAEGANVQVLVQ
jgi:hypothetical protein